MTLSPTALYPATDQMKICSREDCSLAGIPQPLDRFPKGRTAKGGRVAQCKLCSNRFHRQAHARRKVENPDLFRKKESNKNARQRQSENHRSWLNENKERLKLAAVRWRQDNPEKLEKARITARFKRYGVTPEWYNEQLRKQDGKCAICGTSEPKGNGNTFNVDHNHKNCCDERHACDKCRRGLLCVSCNIRLGILETSGWVDKAFEYLSQFK